VVQALRIGLVTTVLLNAPPRPHARRALLPMTRTIKQYLELIRECDREILAFILKNKGQVLERDIRNKLGEPRTTVWRTIKRLEEIGLVEVVKRGKFNVIKIREEYL